jgi:hypothetical protein
MDRNFSVLLDHKDNKSKIISCSDKGLNIRVVPRKNNNKDFKPEDLVLSALFASRDRDGAITEPFSYIDFFILNLDSPHSKEWDLLLFYDAINFYCYEYLKIEYDGVVRDHHLAWECFEMDDDDYSCLNDNEGSPASTSSQL